jgi:hypothetical protein
MTASPDYGPNDMPHEKREKLRIGIMTESIGDFVNLFPPFCNYVSSVV